MTDQLVAEVEAARRAAEERKRHTDRIDKLLVQLRREKPDMTLPEIEKLIDRFYDRATISRKTHPALGEDHPVRRGPRRKS